LEAHSLVCSPREFGEGHEDENGSIGRGEFGHHISWRAHGGLGPHYLLVLVMKSNMKSNEVGTTLKHPEPINGNVKKFTLRI
jgi:hypothetical protein